MFGGLWRWMIGAPLPTHRLADERLSKVRALAALSPDALSSIAYANQEIFLGLVVAGSAGLVYAWPIALAIVALLGIVALSYTQIIRTYPTGGGAYTVARENLGMDFGLVAAAALFIDYILAAAVSLTAGVAAIASAFPLLWPHRTGLALLLLAGITIVNLRGVREAGLVISLPVYLFLAAYLGMLAIGLARAVVEGPGDLQAAAPAPVHTLTLFLVLHTFASGCTALTGIEAISNGVQVFEPPETRNANRTMAAMTVLMAVLFLGSTGLTQYFGIVAGPEETILSALARRVLGTDALYVVVQIAMLLVLVVAANTSFVGFPRLASLLARDSYAPRQLQLLGDRLVFSNGILLLAGLAGILIVVFSGDSHALIPLFAVGAFLAFTLSQAGMVVFWLRQRQAGWGLKAGLNGLGTLVTGLALIVIMISKFADGAWIVIGLIPALIVVFHHIHSHYASITTQLTLSGLPPSLTPLPEPRIILPISGVHRGVIEALRYAASLSASVTAVYVEIEPGGGERVRQRWDEWGLESFAHLDVVTSPYRSVIGPLLNYLDRVDHEVNDGRLATVLLPEFVTAHWWEWLLHNQTAWLIKLALLYRRRTLGRTRGIIDYPLHLRS